MNELFRELHKDKEKLSVHIRETQEQAQIALNELESHITNESVAEEKKESNE